MISELDLPTEATTTDLLDKENIAEVEKPESFVELYEKYNDQFIKNSTTFTDDLEAGEIPLQKRSSDDEISDDDTNTKSVIDKIQSIDDPEVRKEFEAEISNNGQVLVTEDEKVLDDGTEYDPNYAKKLVNLSNPQLAEKSDSENSIQDFDSSKNLSLHEKEILQVHLVEQLVHNMSESNVDYTTVIPDESFVHHEQIKNPEVVEVLEHIVYQSSTVEPAITTADTLNVQVDFDPIEIIPKDRHRFRNVEDVEVTTEKNDKFVGFKPTEDLVEPGEETTEPDLFFKKIENEDESAEKAIIDTLEFVGIFGKSIKFENSSEELKNVNDEIVVTTETPEKISEELTTQVFESITEIIEVHTEISVNIKIEGEKTEDEKSESISDTSSKLSSSSDESSEESKSKKSGSKIKKTKSKKSGKIDEIAKMGSAESSEENSAKEETDTDGFKMFDVSSKNDQNSLLADLYKDTLGHEIKKKDHAEEVLPQQKTTERKFDVEGEIQSRSDDSTMQTTPEVSESTTVGVYETIEDVVTTVSDGIKLTNDLRGSIDSFRGFIDENKTVLDTNSEAISSKNIKTSLVNIAEEMTLENHVAKAENSYFAVSFLGVVSGIVLLSLFVLLKKKSSRIVLF